MFLISRGGDKGVLVFSKLLLYLFVGLEACLGVCDKFFLDSFSALSLIKCLCIGPVITVHGHHPTLLLGGKNSRWSLLLILPSQEFALLHL